MEFFELTGNTRVISGRTLHQVRAIKDINTENESFNLKAGDLGGWIEDAESIAGECLVGPEASVFKDARIFGGCILAGQIFGGKIFGGKIFGGEIFGGQIFGGAIYGGRVFGGQIYAGDIFGGQIHGGKIFGGEIFGGQIFNRDILDGDICDRDIVTGHISGTILQDGRFTLGLLGSNRLLEDCNIATKTAENASASEEGEAEPSSM
jgi:hypothetical protein